MGEKFQRWVRNFGNDASERREQMEGESRCRKRRKSEKRGEKMRGMREKFRLK